MFRTKTECLTGNVHRYVVLNHDQSISYDLTLDLWQNDSRFRTFFLSILAESPFSAYRWETPPITKKTVHRPFEFVLIDAPYLIQPPNGSPFEKYFTNECSNSDIVRFKNLGKDALLVVPCPKKGKSLCGHLASFVREAPENQKHALWQEVGQQIQKELSNRPLWVSTAGGGVDWLHVRLDSEPKYYGYEAYKFI